MTKEKKWIDDWFRWMMKVHTILLSSGVFESSLVCRNHMSMKWAIQLIDCNDKGYKHWYQDLLICHALFCSNNPRKIVKDLVNLFWSVSAFKLISNWFVKRQEKLWVETGDHKWDDESEMVKGLCLVICLFNLVKGVINVGCIERS